MNKSELRNNIRKLRHNMDIEYIDEASMLICKKIEQLNEFISAKNIMIYISFDNEVNLKSLFLEKKREKSFYAPICIDRQNMISVPIESYSKLVNSKVKENLFEPKTDTNKDSSNIIDLIIVPGIAFDNLGNRIGFGAGYYDVFLSKLDRKIPTIGVCYEFQVVDEIQADYNDIPVDYVITEKNKYNPNLGGKCE